MAFSFTSDVDTFQLNLVTLPTAWDGQSCVLELKEANYNWRQMEWWAFYFEYKVKEHLKQVCKIPGDNFFNRVTFDLKTQINWDIKAKAIKSDERRVILNDKLAMEQSIQAHGFHGEIIGLCDVEYNDHDRSFQKWHTALKGGLSKYEKRRKMESGTFSRYRKTSAELMEIIYVVFASKDLEKLDVMNQGKNSNDKPRPPKYSLNLGEMNDFRWKSQQFFEI